MGFLSRQNSKLQTIRKTAKGIAISYAINRDLAPSRTRQIGNRKTLRNPIPPFQRADAVLKNGIYQLAYDIHICGVTRMVEEFVRERDEPFRHKPRNPTAIDWAIRLVDRSPRVPQPRHGIKIVDPLFEPTFASHLATELNFAFRHEIGPEHVSMFIDHVGGHEIISAMEANGGYDLTTETWVSKLRDEALKDHNRQHQAWKDELSAQSLDPWCRRAIMALPSNVRTSKVTPAILENSLADQTNPKSDDNEDWS